MSMPPLPVAGQEPWDAALNAYLAALEDRIDALEARPQYIFNSYAWQFNNGPPPAVSTGGNSQVRLNNANPTLATLIDIRLVDSDGADRTPIFQQLGVGSNVRINDWDANIHRFAVTGPATMNVTNAQIPVSWVSGNGVIPNAKANVAFLIALAQ
jgi:hypothetical protein